ncbi:UDP-N-acetylmuramate dehydrogenase [Clostridium manihotivorum]|uniref:UDP-N-acetylenolpyruvoylglucosamine reductase n=1 Tax=Clostridium manihotivorum TaxID=2320868 RepID=A0A410DYG5_9CLOT|nr:UDP-N-acetylmuramate dehydrogenase [Clostridium manihotivorum]QAA34082.1 UDP-N-acetylenolpyruvoylglucosamine reductase [Clostridium manihotivorum]
MKTDHIVSCLEVLLDKKNIFVNEPMSKHTTFRVGGNADVLVSPANIDELISVLEYLRLNNVKHIVIGNGSNVVVEDSGYRGVIVKTSKLNSINIKENVLEAGCGAFLSTVSKIALEHGLAGTEFLSGIPGTIGGAITMNAGAYNSEISDIIDYAMVLKQDKIEKISKSELMLSYRNSIIQKENYTVLSAGFNLKKDSYEAIHSKMSEIQAKRISSQPLNYPNAGSIFKRINGHPVGAVIENAGLKNVAIGGAKVSEKHANFIVNTGNATAKDIKTLIELVKKTVKDKTDIDLETEVKFIG